MLKRMRHTLVEFWWENLTPSMLRFLPWKIARVLGLQPFFAALQQWKRDRAARARFNAFCKSKGLRRIKGQWHHRVNGVWILVPPKGKPNQ